MSKLNIDKRRPATKLLWVDMEMTGLDQSVDRILEVAAIVTDWDFAELASFEAIVHHSDDVLSSMNPWAAAHHSANGLTARVRSSEMSEKEVISQFCSFIVENFGDEPPVLAGNSIHNDRKFIEKWWPQVELLLHYRMLDVSSYKLVQMGKYGAPEFKKSNDHRAMGDIRSSIAELRHYLSLNVKNL